MSDLDKTEGQRARFEQAARELGVEFDEAKLRDALRKIAPEKDDNSEPKPPADE